MQTKWLIPFKSEIYHPLACLHFLRIPSNLPSCEAFRDEEITTGHWSSSSKYAYFNYVGRGLSSSFRGSSFSLSLSINKGRISSFFFSKDKKQHIIPKVYPVFQEALPIPPSIMPIAKAAHTVLPQWCQSNTPRLGLLPRDEHAFC